MERFWNIVYYCAYKVDYKLHMAFRKIEPVSLTIRLLYKIPKFRNFQEKRGRSLLNMDKDVQDAFKRPDHGISVIFAGGLMGLLIMILFFGLQLLYIAFIEKPKSFEQFAIIFIIYTIISVLISYIFLFRKDKYLKYFKEFDKEPRKWKIKWAWISLGVILFPFVVMVLGFAALTP